MKTTMAKLRRTIRKVLVESSDGYNGEEEIWSQLKKNADQFRSESQADGGVLKIAGGAGDSFSITNADEYFYIEVYDDNFPEDFIDELEQARGQGFDEIELSYQMNTEHLTIDDMINRAQEIAGSMYQPAQSWKNR